MADMTGVAKESLGWADEADAEFSLMTKAVGGGDFEMAGWVTRRFAYDRGEVAKQIIYVDALESGNSEMAKLPERGSDLSREDLTDSRCFTA